MLRFFSLLIRLLFSLRYRLILKGLKLSELKDQKSLVFLPNHPSKLDSFLIFFLLCQKGIWVRPIGVEYIFQWPWMRPLLKRFRAIPIPTFKNGVNQYKMHKSKEALRQIVEGLKAGESFLLFPSGKTKKTGKEELGGASGIYFLCQECPELQIVLLRITGLWGSSFSKVPNEKASEIQQRIGEGVRAVLKNGIFFTPRRKVTIEIEWAPEVWKEGALSKVEWNRRLEEWYNHYLDREGKRHSIEPLIHVPLSFWGQKKKREPEVIEESVKKRAVSPKTVQLVESEIFRILNQPATSLSPEFNLSTDLGMDSLNIAELIGFLARRTKSTKILPEQLQTVQDVWHILEEGPPLAARLASSHQWPKEKKRFPVEITKAPTIPEALFQLCQKRGKRVMCADDFVGVFTYRRFQQAVAVLAKHFASFPEERIALLLPASVTTYVAVVALQVAGKIPVMLNWTLGLRYLDQMMQIAGAKRILTSWNFIDRLQYVDFGKWADHLQFLEHIRSELKFTEKLGAIFPKWDLSNVREEAVILFTSGSEAAPKGVPLTHQNILANFRSLCKGFPFQGEDISYSTLPPFHSLGFTVAGLFPLLMGIRTAFFPDPTDALGIAEGVKRWQISHLPLAPTFLKGVLDVAKEEDLATVRFFVCGGERTPSSLFEVVAEKYPQARLRVGYGVTECSPCIAIDSPFGPQCGVGQILPDIEILTIDPETKALLPKGSVGEVCVFGPNVFKGYLGNGETPFIEIEGKQWYRTGDRGFVDPNGALILAGRLKRFVKIGAEMISLVAIEEALTRPLFEMGGEAPACAVSSQESPTGKAEIFLFSKVAITREKANALLREAGLSALVKIDQIISIEEIPLSATGKIDYKRLSIEKNSNCL